MKDWCASQEHSESAPNNTSHTLGRKTIHTTRSSGQLTEDASFLLHDFTENFILLRSCGEGTISYSEVVE